MNSTLKAFSVLCVEDEIEIRNIIFKLLHLRVKNLYFASNGLEGIEQFKLHSPDIIVSDIVMPMMNGLEMIQAIKKIDKNVPIIITTAFDDSHFCLNAIEYGVCKYVLKPIQFKAFITAIEEVAWLLRAQRELHISETVFQASAEAIVITDGLNRIISVNSAFTIITGYESSDVVGKDPSILKSGRQGCEFYQAMWDRLKNKHRWEGEIWNRRKSGEIYPEWLTISSVLDNNNEPLYYVAIFSDMTMRKQAESQLYHLAHYDPLTNLPNRTLLQDRLTQAIGQAARNDKTLAVMFIDLDRFKYVNDTFGHLIGDLLLQEVSFRLNACVRSSDTVARIGGDEFFVLLPQVTDTDSVAKIAQNIIEKLTAVFLLETHEINIGCSIGIALYPDNGNTPEILMKASDSAMYAVKESGKNNFRFFNNKINQILQNRLEIEADFYSALHQNQFEVFYQPIFGNKHEILGAEVSVRWNKADGTVLNLNDFLPLAEQTGFILPLGKWMFQTALTEIKKNCHNPNLKITIGVSINQLKAQDFSEFVHNLLQELHFSPKQLELDISEQVLIKGNDTVFFALNYLSNLGVSIAIDDFGAGYATLLHLNSLPVSRVKLDRKLITHAENAGKDTSSIISALIAVANSLSLKVTVRGLDNAQQEFLVKNQNATLERQGIFLAKPLSIFDFNESLNRHTENE